MIQRLYHFLADFVCTRIPQPIPTSERLAAAGIISHRGEHDNRQVFENTFDAFDAAVSAGVDGIECDIRWTQDLHPVIFHDSDLKRLFGTDCRLADMQFSQLRSEFPSIPSLFELVERYGGKVHLMVEIKKEPYPAAEQQTEILRSAFSTLEPVLDYHFLSLAPEMFDLVGFVPKKTCLPIAELNVTKISRLSLQKGYGGILGHFYLVGTHRIMKHKKKGQQVGTGYPVSENCLYREINRGVDWIFTEKANKVSRIRKKTAKAVKSCNLN